MPQKPDLAAALAGAGGSTRRAPAAPNVSEGRSTGSRRTVRPAAEAKREVEARAKAVAVQPGRAGTKPITAHLPGQVRGQLKLLAVERGRTLQDMMAEAFNDLFAKYGKPEIAPVSRQSN